MKPPAAAVPPALPARRRFLQAGVAGTVLLAAVPRLHGARGPGEAPVSTRHRIALQAIVPVLLAGALPADAGRAAAVTAVVDGIEQAVRGLPLHLQAEVGELFSLLSFAPTRILVVGVVQPWSEASPTSIASFLDRWRTSWFGLLRSAYQALHELVMAAWYARPEAWAALGYSGPPRVG